MENKDIKIKPRIDWTINIGEMISVATILVLGTLFIAGQQEQISANRIKIAAIEKRMDRSDTRMENAVNRIEKHLLEIRKEISKK